jgi:hypothetical protein
MAYGDQPRREIPGKGEEFPEGMQTGARLGKVERGPLAHLVGDGAGQPKGRLQDKESV